MKRVFISVGCILLYSFFYCRKWQRPKLLRDEGQPRISRLLQLFPQIEQAGVPNLFFFNGHLQLILFVIMCRICKKNEYESETITLRDGQKVILDWLHPPSPKPGPIVVIFHGITGSSDSLGESDMAKKAMQAGLHVVIFNRRGIKADLTVPKMELFGDSLDTHEVLTHVCKTEPSRRLALVGVSAGSADVARYCGDLTIARGLKPKEGILCTVRPELFKDSIWENADDIFDRLTCSVLNCPGFDTSVCLDRMPAWLENVVLSGSKRVFIKNHEDFWRNQRSDVEIDRALNSATLAKFYRELVSLSGYTNYEEYTHSHNPVLTALQAQGFGLIINGSDDLLCKYRNIKEWGPDIKTAIKGGEMMHYIGQWGGHCCSFDWKFDMYWNTMTLQYIQCCEKILQEELKTPDGSSSTAV